MNQHVISHTSSFLSSLDDDELLDYINKLSQEQKKNARSSQQLTSHQTVTSLNVSKDRSSTNLLTASFLESSFTFSDDTEINVGRSEVNEGRSEVNEETITNPLVCILKQNKSGIIQRHGSQSGEFRQTPLEEDKVSNDPLSLETDDTVERFFQGIDNEIQPASQIASDDEAEPETREFGDFGGYIREKHDKQQKSDLKYLEWEKERKRVQGDIDEVVEVSNIFANCVVHVNGYTQPGISEIHRLVIMNGGRFLHYLGAKGNATHIVCSRLTPRKRLEFARYKVVKPEWILECVNQKKLLPWFDFALINNDYGQQKLEMGKKNEDANPDNKQKDLGSNEDELEEDDEFQLSPLAEEDDKPQSSQIVEPPKINGMIMDAKHPEFLKGFFAKSRLHHLSVWKTDLRAEFLEKVLTEQKMASEATSPKTNSTKVIMHIDFDCFFATVSALKRPDIDFQNQPVCVTHGGSSSDVASCNYAARKKGVTNGTWLGSARKKCPDLICLDYDFPEYERISRCFYDYFISLKPDSILPVSVDEALLEVSSLCIPSEGVTLQMMVQRLAKRIRDQIFNLTNCHVSVGAAKNVLLAKLSLRKAKPNGQFYLGDEAAIPNFLRDLSIKELPGTGYSIFKKLCNEFGTRSFSVGQLSTITKDKLINLFGIKTGSKLFEYARGIDNTNIDITKNPEEFSRKSVSVDVNWGIRFETVEQVDQFFVNLAQELHERLSKVKMAGYQIALRLAKRGEGAPVEPPKFLGMGSCDFFSKSSKFGVPTNDQGMLSSEMKSLYRIIYIEPKELRGIAVTMNKLVSVNSIVGTNQMKLPFAKLDVMPEFPKGDSIEQKQKPVSISQINPLSQVSASLIPSDIDSSVIKELPSSIQREIEAKRNKLDNLEQPPQPIKSEIDTPHNIDWDVFNELPSSIRNELANELTTRGISPTKSPRKLGVRHSPSKTYLQQTFPSSPGASPSFVRVRSPVRALSVSPVKKRPIKSPSPSIQSKKQRYDEKVLNELPSSIRKEILQELEYEETISKYSLTPLRERLLREKNAGGYLDHIDPVWFPPSFQKESSIKNIEKMASEWIRSTIHKLGPHETDTNIFKDYLNDLLAQDNLTRCLRLLEEMKMTIGCEKRILECQKHDLVGVLDWERSLDDLQAVVASYCNVRNIRYDI